MNPSNVLSFTAGATMNAGARVKLTTGKLQLAGLTDGRAIDLGTLEQNTIDGAVVGVRCRTATGSRRMIADGAIALYATVYSAASGKVSATNGASSKVQGIALTAAGADGDYVTVLTDPE